MRKEILTCSAHDTRLLGETLGKSIRSPLAVALSGDLGTGKTTFVQGLARGLGVPDRYYVTSPTYTIINEYPGRLPLYHLDLYRLGSVDDLEYLGFDEIASSEAVIIVEWPDLIDEAIMVFDMEIRITTDQNFNRKFSMVASGLDAVNLLQNLSIFNNHQE